MKFEPFQYMEVSFLLSIHTSTITASESAFNCEKLDHVHMTVSCGFVDRVLLKGQWEVRTQPLNDLQVPIGCSCSHYLGRDAPVMIGSLTIAARCNVCKEDHRGPTFRVTIMEILYDGQVAICSSILHSVVGAAFSAIRMQPLDDIQMTLSCSAIHGPLVAQEADAVSTYTSGLVHPLKNFKVTSKGRQVHGGWQRIDGFLLMQPLENVEMPADCRSLYSFSIALVVLIENPLHHLQVAITSRCPHRTIEGEDASKPVTLFQDLDHDKAVACGCVHCDPLTA